MFHKIAKLVEAELFLVVCYRLEGLASNLQRSDLVWDSISSDQMRATVLFDPEHWPSMVCFGFEEAVDFVTRVQRLRYLLHVSKPYNRIQLQ